MEKQVIEKLIQLKKEYSEAEEQLLDPEVISNVSKVTSLNKIIKKNENKISLFNE